MYESVIVLLFKLLRIIRSRSHNCSDKGFFFFKLLGTAKRKTAASLPPKNKNEPHRWGLYHNNTDCLELTKSLHMFESLMVFPLELFHIITSCGQAHDAL